MEPASWGFIGSLLGAVVGASASVATTAINARHSFRLQAASKEWEKAEKFSSFQQETLLAIQGAVQNLTRLMARAHLKDRKSYATTGVWGREPLGEELNEEIGEANRVLASMVERVANDELRGNIKHIQAGITEVIMSKSYEDAIAKFSSVAKEYNELMLLLGSTLRSLY